MSTFISVLRVCKLTDPLQSKKENMAMYIIDDIDNFLVGGWRGREES